MVIQHLDVVITNGIVALLSFYFGMALLSSPTMHYDLRRLLVGSFLSIAAASIAAGYFHGWLQEGTDSLRPLAWRAVVLFIGLTGFYMWRLLAFFVLPQRWRRVGDIFTVLLLVGYCYFVTNERDDFMVAVLFYLPAVVLLMFTFLIKWLAKKDARYIRGFLGLFVTIVASAAQASKFDIDPVYFSHNAIYHLIQALGLYLFYQFSLRIIVWKT